MKQLLYLISFLGILNANEQTIEIVYHVAMLKNWESIVKEQLARVERSGLGEACDQMTITALGRSEAFGTLKKMTTALSFKNKLRVLHISQNLHLYEFPGIEQVISIAEQNPMAKILYIHNKGVSHFGKPLETCAQSWRRYMEYFAIDHWKDCIDALEEADACGVEFTIRPNGIPFFAGNFWWANGAYVNTCRLAYTNRFDCEDFIGTGFSPKMKSFHDSGINLYFEIYPEEKYKYEEASSTSIVSRSSDQL